MELVGKIIHLDNNNNLVFKFDLELDLSKYQTLESKCDICNTIKYRKETYIIKNDNNELIQVGSNCVKKALGRQTNDKEFLLMNACPDFNDEWKIGLFNSKFVDKKIYLLKLIKYSENGFNKEVNELIFDKTDKTKIEDLKKYEDEYNKMIEFYKDNNFNNNNFKSNVKALILQDMFPLRCKNIVKYAYKVYCDDTKHNELVNSIKCQESFNDSEDFIIKDIKLESSYEDTSYYYKGITFHKYMILTTNNFLLQFESSSIKDFMSWIGKHCSCEIKKEYISTIKGKVTIIKKLKLI